LIGLNVRIAFLRVEATAGTSAHTIFGESISYQMYLSRGPLFLACIFRICCFLGLRDFL